MDGDGPFPMTPFDTVLTSPKLQLIKLLLPFLPVSGRRMLAAYVKFAEFRNALAFFRENNAALQSQMFGAGASSSLSELLDLFRPYLDPEQKSLFDTFMNVTEMVNMMEMMQQMQGTENGSGESAFDPMSLLSGMFSPEQQELFRTYSDLFTGSADSDQKGDDTDERLDESSGNEKYGSGEA